MSSIGLDFACSQKVLFICSVALPSSGIMLLPLLVRAQGLGASYAEHMSLWICQALSGTGLFMDLFQLV